MVMAQCLKSDTFRRNDESKLRVGTNLHQAHCGQRSRRRIALGLASGGFAARQYFPVWIHERQQHLAIGG